MSVERVVQVSGSRCLAVFLFLCLAFPIRLVVPNRIKHHSNVCKGAMYPLPLLFRSVMGGNMFGKAGSLLTCLENGEGVGLLLGLKFKLPLLACNPAH